MNNLILPSKHLERNVVVDVFLPPQYDVKKKETYPIFYFNDGQDMPRLAMFDTLTQLFETKKLQPCIVVAAHCNENRINEYGTARQADYKNRGNKAPQYTRFVVDELVPYVRSHYKCSTIPAQNIIAGFSLSALSAIDIAWATPSVFGKVGVFSGSLWWRSQPWTPTDPDGGRIMHDIIAQSERRDNMKFWFEVGTKDEEGDRNNNGIIDAIDDTVDLIEELCKLGYRPHEDIKYLEIQGGEHSPTTWGKAMPDFLTWALTN
ncbi:MAG: alpha/beta hydrolase-fold protein [Saprospiraceae bacterium]|nr:alpha/beta hydrolase-fold protein [Saprospiraceae bacterium]